MATRNVWKSTKTGLDPNQTSRPFTVSQYTIITIYDNYIGSDVCYMTVEVNHLNYELKISSTNHNVNANTKQWNFVAANAMR